MTGASTHPERQDARRGRKSRTRATAKASGKLRAARKDIPRGAGDLGEDGNAPLVQKIAIKLGGEALLKASVRSQGELAALVQKRLPLESLKRMARAGFSERELSTHVIAERTRRHRAKKQEDLTVEESDKAVRLLRIQTLAEETFGDTDKAATWLRRPLSLLGGETPLSVARTETGARVIETLLAKIAWGAAA